MKHFYSVSTKGFYRDDIHSVIPDDVIEITEEQKQALLDGQLKGGKIVEASEGDLDLVFPSQEELDERQRINSIAELESSITPRNLRGAALGDSFAIAKIQQVESDIAALRVSG